MSVGFADGSWYSGSLVIGADGSGSSVRKAICPESWQPHALTVIGTGVSVKYSVEKLKPVLALDPVLFEASHPQSNSFMFFSSTCLDGFFCNYRSYVVQQWIAPAQAKTAHTKCRYLSRGPSRTRSGMP